MSNSKPSFFKRPAWAATAKAASPGAENTVFGHQNVYDDILAAERSKREEREARQKLKKDKSTASTATEDHAEQPKRKRRKVSKELDEPKNSSSSSERSSPAHTTPEPEQPKRSLRNTPHKKEALLDGLSDEKRPRQEPKTVIVSLDDSDEDDDTITAKAPLMKTRSIPESKQASKAQPPSPPEDEEEDPFLRELQRKAREKARQQHAKQSTSTSRTSGSYVDKTGSPAPRSTDGLTDDTAIDPAEPIVGILIKTHIPNTTDVIINRRPSQPLQQVKEYWTKRHNLEPEFSKQVFFTWRGTRLYNSSTSTSLINILKRESGIPVESDEDPSDGRLQVEAVTQDILDQQARAKAELAAAKEAARSGTGAGDDTNDQAQEEPARKEGLVLVLRCKGVEDLPLRVRPNTSVGKIMRAFQSQRGIDKSKKCWLIFDGDRLEEDMSAQEAGLEDQVVVEVHPR